MIARPRTPPLSLRYPRHCDNDARCFAFSERAEVSRMSSHMHDTSEESTRQYSPSTTARRAKNGRQTRAYQTTGMLWLRARVSCTELCIGRNKDKWTGKYPSSYPIEIIPIVNWKKLWPSIEWQFFYWGDAHPGPILETSHWLIDTFGVKDNLGALWLGNWYE